MIRVCIRGLSKPTKTTISDKKGLIYWDCDGSINQYTKDVRKINKFDIVMSTVVNNKLFQKGLKSKFSKKDQDEFMNMINNQTSINIIREPTAKELTDNESSIKKAWNKLLKSRKHKKIR